MYILVVGKYLFICVTLHGIQFGIAMYLWYLYTNKISAAFVVVELVRGHLRVSVQMTSN